MPFDLVFMNPFSLMRRMTEEMDRAFQNSNSSAKAGTALWTPAVEVSQIEGQYLVRGELPGLKPYEVQVEVTDDGLVLERERKFERDLDKFVPVQKQFFDRKSAGYRLQALADCLVMAALRRIVRRRAVSEGDRRRRTPAGHVQSQPFGTSETQ
jgi:hypothetical protein